MPKLSIILTVYEINEQYLWECLCSLYAQTFQDFVIIAVNDCSPKTNYDWLKAQEKVQYVYNEKNLGMSASVNKAFGLVNTEYVVRLGSDDLFDPNLLHREVSFLDRHKKYVAVCCEMQTFGNSSRYIRRPEEWDLQNALSYPHYHGYAGGMMFRASLLSKVRIMEKYHICEDYDFHLQLMECGKIRSIHEPLYFYRQHDAQVTSNSKHSYRMEVIKSIVRSHKKRP